MTFRPNFPLLLILMSGMCAQGCTNLMARRAIVSFADSLESKDLEQIRTATSSEFEARALRQPEAMSDLKLMRFPKGDIRIVQLDPVNETTKLVTVEIGEEEKAKTVDYRLTLDRESGKWVVDDVILSQDDTTGQQIRRSVTDQMDLLLTCRELLKDWESAPRTVRLQHCTQELHAELSKLPPNWFDELTQKTVGSGRSVTFRPEARLNGDRAVVVAPHSEGSLFVEFHKELNYWKVQNIALEKKHDSSTESRSLLQIAKTLNHSVNFLTAFSDGDLEQLQAFATPDFYEQSLANGDLDSIELPVAMMIADKYSAKTHQDRTELLLEANGTTYMLTVRQVDTKTPEGSPGPNEARVDEVTIFEADGAEVKKVSAMLLSSSVVDLYVDALRTRNLQQIRAMSSNDFNERVWKTEASKHFGIMPYPMIEEGETEVISTVFRGDITEITVAQGNTPMTFILRLGEGWMVIDDVHLPAQDRPVSLKANLELLLPIQAFASAVNRRDVDGASKYSDGAMDQIVWRQLNYVPEVSRELVRPLMSEVIRIAPSGGWITVHTSDGMISSEIKLSREGNQYVIHDVTLTNEASPTKQFDFMKNVRSMISQGELLPKGAQPGSFNRQQTIIQASAVETAGEESQPSPISRAVFEPISPEVYSR